MAVIEETKKGDWAVWERNARYVARFPTKAEAEEFRRANYAPAPASVQPRPRLNKTEAHAFAQWEARPEQVLPGLGVATVGLVKKGYLTVDPCDGGYLVRVK